MANVESSRMNADELTAQCLQMKFLQLESVHAPFCQSFVDRLIARREKESAAKLAHVESTLIDLNEEPRDADDAQAVNEKSNAVPKHHGSYLAMDDTEQNQFDGQENNLLST
ncbi:hypothetical protein BS78_K060100 [Paspalum vaginatum]|uniref:Uncharacterized protein n=1 Tax=Paspalum vaginatum TaxID=158149 RepID=A0A9W8CEV4_9POAL|nr:hypothetical protein BS78_K060100 [Paspalum vaginatum]